MQRPAALRPISSTRSQWVYLFVTLLIVLPLILAFVFSNQIYAVYLREFVAPRLEREFGFKAGRTQVQFRGRTDQVFAVLRVTPGGILHRAGVEPGDIPVGYQHGFETGFLQDLVWAKEGHAVEIELARPPDLEKRKRIHLPAR